MHPDNAQTCYSSFRRAMADATGGQITNAPDSGRAAATDAALDARINDLAKHASKAGTAARRPVVVGIEWSNRDARGSSWIIEFFDRCRRGYYFVRNLGGNWWNDRISSYKSYAGCRVNHYENQNARGSSTGWHYGYVSYIGNAMNDQTSSVMWSS
ncbi:hypothetical protein [Actinomadura macrotermitis]|uniref:hypothetical protein n=1 Tax=Actinomadura macrotermitis TaxID=2585200 RepID=UPI001295015E|nr:hypothetical protein [Actinomadura macrotermitis]